MKSKESILVLCDIRSAENVGSLFRTADAAGISKIYLCGITPAPIDRFGRVVRAIAKTALGAERTVLWEMREDAKELLSDLKKERYQLIAIEQAPGATDYKKVEVSSNTVFILGAEVEGLPKDILALAQVVAEIPMKGEKESLNVAVAGGIAMFRILGI